MLRRVVYLLVWVGLGCWLCFRNITQLWSNVLDQPSWDETQNNNLPQVVLAGDSSIGLNKATLVSDTTVGKKAVMTHRSKPSLFRHGGEIMPTSPMQGVSSQQHANQTKYHVSSTKPHHDQYLTQYDDKDDTHYCKNEGSLHQLALNMIQLSSPKGSPSYIKLRHVLSQNSLFHMELLPQTLFNALEHNMIEFAEGWGMREQDISFSRNQSNVTFFQEIMGVGLSWSQLCDLHHPACHMAGSRAFVILQSEQLYASQEPRLNRTIRKCHALESCVLLDFSSHNLKWAQENDVADSFVLLPVMTQSPSRIMPLQPPKIPRLTVPLINRSKDVSFFGRRSTPRRRRIFCNAQNYGTVANRTTYFRDLIGAKRNGQWARLHMAQSYADTKVCLVAHTFPIASSGELHRLSEFAPFGCIPVMETFADTIGLEQYRRCAKVHYASFDHLFEETERVLKIIDNNAMTLDHVKWWSAGVRWRDILPTVFGSNSPPV